MCVVVVKTKHEHAQVKAKNKYKQYHILLLQSSPRTYFLSRSDLKFLHCFPFLCNKRGLFLFLLQMRSYSVRYGRDHSHHDSTVTIPRNSLHSNKVVTASRPAGVRSHEVGFCLKQFLRLDSHHRVCLHIHLSASFHSSLFLAFLLIPDKCHRKLPGTEKIITDLLTQKTLKQSCIIILEVKVKEKNVLNTYITYTLTTGLNH